MIFRRGLYEQIALRVKCRKCVYRMVDSVILPEIVSCLINDKVCIIITVQNIYSFVMIVDTVYVHSLQH